MYKDVLIKNTIGFFYIETTILKFFLLFRCGKDGVFL